MDIKRKKELLDAWKNCRPKMGVISIRCKATGDLFLGISKDTRADFNSARFKLSANGHPNRQLQELWNLHGENNFEFSVAKLLKYENPTDAHTDELKLLLERCLMEASQARRIWK